MKTLKEIKAVEKSILIYNEKRELVLNENNVQTDELVFALLDNSNNNDVIEIFEDDEILTVILNTKKDTKMKTLFYKNGMAGGTEKDRNDFYNLLEEIKGKAINTSHEYSGDYSVFTYDLKDGKKAIYTVDDNYGISYSLEF